MGNQVPNGERRREVGMTVLILFVVVVPLVIAFSAFRLDTCDKCGGIIFGKGYYAYDALWSSSEIETTLCKTCAAKSWAPFDYRSHAK